MAACLAGAVRGCGCVAALLVLAAGCGGDATIALDAGTDLAPAQLSLSVSVSSPSIPSDLVVTSGFITLETLGLVGDTTYDSRTQIPHAMFPLGGPAQSFVFDMAVPGIYSRLQAEIDHIEIEGTWRGTPLHIDSDDDERLVDIRGPDQELSAAASAPFALSIDGATWLTAAILDSAPMTNGTIFISEHTTPDVVDQMLTLVLASFSLTTP